MITANLDPPHLWYDFYVRVIPGAVFLAYLRSIGMIGPDVWQASPALLLLVGGWAVGLIGNAASTHVADLFQAAAAWRYFDPTRNRLPQPSDRTVTLARLVEKRGTGWSGRSPFWSFYCQLERARAEGGRRTSYAIHSKMHAEVVAMVQLSVLSLVGAFAAISKHMPSWWIWIISVVSLASAFSFAFRRVRRIVTNIPGIAFD